MISGNPTVLLTGATGMVGSELLDHILASNLDRQIILLTHQRRTISRLTPNGKVTMLPGDITQSQLGLDPTYLAQLQNSLTDVIHCAAETRFGLPLEKSRAINTEGTHHLLELARRCKKLEKFAHVSTVFVAGRSTGWISEQPISHGNGFCNSYQQSKYEAEALVVKAMRDIPTAIFRLSSIIGHSQTGRVRKFNYVHQLLRVFPRNVLAMIPGDKRAPIDLIPTDWACAALAALIESSFRPGQVYHVCAGPHESLNVGELIDLTLELFEQHPRSQRWLPIHLPKLVSIAEYEDYVERSRKGDDILLNEFLRVLGYFLPHLGMFQAFENKQTQGFLEASGLQLPPIRDYYGKVVNFCLETNWKLEVPVEY